MSFKSGFISLVGPTNSGKSTLLNAMIGSKVSIVSPLPQTTYHGIRGIKHGKNYELVITDTPGFQNYREYIPRLLNKVADRNAEDADTLLWVFDVSNPKFEQQLGHLKSRIEKKGKAHSICILNKVDKIQKPALFPILEKLHASNLFDQVIPISARRNDGVDRVLKIVQEKLSEGQAYYGADQTTDRDLDFRIKELIREKIYQLTREEIPYSVRLEMEEVPEAVQTNKTPTFYVVIHVDSDSRKGILIGKKGEMLKKIGMYARKDIEKMLGKKICLKLHIDVEAKWTENSSQIEQYLELT